MVQHLTRHVVLVGMTASGKTSVAKAIARELGVTPLDTDDIVEEIGGRSVREIFSADGEEVFRELESRALNAALSHDEPSVIAVAAGAVTIESNRKLLVDAAREGRADVVWLRCAVESLLPRVAAEGHRPLLDNDPADTLQSMAATRTPLYESVATAAVETDGQDIAHVTARVIDLVVSSSSDRSRS